MTIRELYRIYQEERNISLSISQFTLFVEFFPTILVVLSDGVIDQEERSYINRLASNLGNSFVQDGYSESFIKKLKDTFSQEFEFLIQNLKLWEGQFLDALAEHLKENPENKEAIFDTIHLFAATSEDWDETEDNMIEFLSKKLALK